MACAFRSIAVAVLLLSFPFHAQGRQVPPPEGTVADLTAWLQAVTPKPTPVTVPEVQLNETLGANVEQEDGKTAATVFSDLKSSADELKKQIEDAEYAHETQIREHEDSLKAMLKEQQANISNLEEQNTLLRDEIAHLRSSTESLFQHAKQLKLESKVWRDNWREMEQNVTLVLKVTQKSLTAIEDTGASPELNIISELNQRVQRDQGEEYRSDIMKKVAGEVMALLSVKAGSTKGTPSTVVQVLDLELAEMAEATSAEMKRLDEAYGEIFKSESKREEDVLTDQLHLQATKESLMRLEEKLQAAVNKLEELKNMNEQKGSLIRQYARELSDTPVPTNGTKGESWTELTAEEREQADRLAKRFAPGVLDEASEASSRGNETHAEEEPQQVPQTEDAPAQPEMVHEEFVGDMSTTQPAEEVAISNAASGETSEVEPEAEEVVAGASATQPAEEVATSNAESGETPEVELEVEEAAKMDDDADVATSTIAPTEQLEQSKELAEDTVAVESTSVVSEGAVEWDTDENATAAAMTSTSTESPPVEETASTASSEQDAPSTTESAIDAAAEDSLAVENKTRDVTMDMSSPLEADEGATAASVDPASAEDPVEESVPDHMKDVVLSEMTDNSTGVIMSIMDEQPDFDRAARRAARQARKMEIKSAVSDIMHTHIKRHGF